VDKAHNQFKAPRLRPDEGLWQKRAEALVQEQFLLDDASRPVVDQAIRDHCNVRRWHLHALNVRTTHVHAIVHAPTHAIEATLDQLKAWSTRRLREAGLITPDRKVWTAHGSRIYIFKPEVLAEKIEYVLHGQ
jgi:REP element-mobilizing transposase RayT